MDDLAALPVWLRDHIVIAENECWEWTGSIDSRGGYAQVRVPGAGRTMKRAHRVVFELLVESATGCDVGHNCHDEDSECAGGPRCRHRRCIRPSHLRRQTRRENLLAGRGVAASRSAQTQCIYGHEFTPENTAIRTNGTRRCRACDRDRHRVK